MNYVRKHNLEGYKNSGLLIQLSTSAHHKYIGDGREVISAFDTPYEDIIGNIDWSKVKGDCPQRIANNALRALRTMEAGNEPDYEDCTEDYYGSGGNEEDDDEEREFEDGDWDGNAPSEEDLRFIKNATRYISSYNTETYIEYVQSDVPTSLFYLAQASTIEHIVNNTDMYVTDEDLLTFNFMVKIYLTFIEHQKVLFVLQDDSGSMQSAITVLVSLLELLVRKVESDEIQMYHSYFEMSYFTFEKVQPGFRKKWHKPNGGNTYIEKAIELLVLEMDKLNLRFKEILIINDGQDYIDPSYVAPCIVNCICLGVYNENLEKVCKASGGTYILLNIE